ncbi:lysozyme [Brevundimonas sp.]|uniref:lysozyme n=1 Tax=Brevundimonas sp. TaxID=1871086 RepID=UPI0037851B7D
MKLSKAGENLMHRFEGCKNKPYLCPAHIWTIGYGHVLYQEQIRLPVVRVEGKETPMIRKEMPLKPEDNRVWTKEEIDELFRDDVGTFERGVLRLVPGVAGRQGAFDALVSISFNFGLGNLQRSTIRMRANRGDWDGAAEAFRVWTKGGGKVLPGLVKRREAEIALFLS